MPVHWQRCTLEGLETWMSPDSSPIQRAVMLIVVSLKGGISGDTMVLIVMVLTLSYLVDTIVLIVVVVTLMALILVVLTLVLVSHQW